MSVREQFLESMSHAASTVNIVTTDGPHGRAGVTVSAMCSVSADPPSLLVCVNQASSSCEAIRSNGVLCVNVLKDDQFYISDTFASRIKTHDGDKFSCASWKKGSTGAPVLVDALAGFDCKISSYFQSGSHMIFVAEVQAIESTSDGHPLIYAKRAYGTPLKLEAFLPPSDQQEQVSTVNVGCFVTVGPFFMPQLLRGFLQEDETVRVSMDEGTQDTLLTGLESGQYDVALMYDVGLGSHIARHTLTEMTPHVLLASEHPLAKRSSISLADLENEPMVLLDIPPSRDYFSSLFAGLELTPRIEYLSPSFEMVRGLVGNGLGYALLITKPANAMSYDGKALTTRPINGEVKRGKVVIAHVTGRELSEPAQKFYAYCCRYFSTFSQRQSH